MVSGGRVAGAFVFPVLGAGWVRNINFFLVFVVCSREIGRGGED